MQKVFKIDNITKDKDIQHWNKTNEIINDIVSLQIGTGDTSGTFRIADKDYNFEVPIKNIITTDTEQTITGTKHFKNLDSENANVTNFSATNGTVATLISTTGTIDTLNSTNGTIDTLISTNSTIDALKSTNGTIDTLTSTKSTIDTLNSTNGAIDTLTSTNSTITTLASTNGTIKTLGTTDLTATNSSISNLTVDKSITINDIFMNSISNAITEAMNSNDPNNLLFSTVKNMKFTNLPPKIGFLDDTKANIYGSFNMGWFLDVYGAKVFNDVEGREVLFIRAKASNYTAEKYKLYKATRTNTTDSFIFENDPILPGFITNLEEYDAATKNVYVYEMYAITDEYAVLHVIGGRFGSGAHVLVFTRGSGFEENWNDASGWLTLSGTASPYNGFVRVKHAGKTFYIVPSVSTANETVLSIPEKEVNVTGVATTINLNIYEVVEDTNNHTMSIVSSRQEKCCTFGKDMYGTSTSWNSRTGYIPSSLAGGGCYAAYLNDFNELVIGFTSSGTRYHYADDDYRAIVDGWTTWSFTFSYDFKPENIMTQGYFQKKYDEIEKIKAAGGNLPSDLPTFSYTFIRDPYKLYHNCPIDGCTSQHATLSYSSLTKNLYFVYNQHDSFYQTYRRYNLANEGVLDKFHEITSINSGSIPQTSDSYLTTPDVSPWSKQAQGLLIMNNSYLLSCNSKSFGTSRAYIEPEQMRDNNNNIVANAFVPKIGCWTRDTGWEYGLVSNIMSCCRNVNDTSQYGGSKWYWTSRDSNSKTIYVHNITASKTLKLENDDSISNGIQLVSTDNDKKAVCSSTYNSIFNANNIMFCCYSDANNSLGEKFVVLKFNQQAYSNGTPESVTDDLAFGAVDIVNMNGTFTEYKLRSFAHKTMNADGSTSDYDYNYYICKYRRINSGIDQTCYFDNGRCSNMFIDSDGKIYFRYWLTSTGSTYFPKYLCIDLNDRTVYHYADNWFYWSISAYPLGYTNDWGYYRSAANIDVYSRLTVECTKDKWGTDTSKPNTMHALLGRNCYTKYMFTSATTGLVAYLQRTPIYLGGYFGYIPEQEIYLMDNCDNYVYISRANDSETFNVEIYDHILGSQDSMQFSRVLIARIRTRNGNIDTGEDAQETYEVNYYGGATTNNITSGGASSGSIIVRKTVLNSNGQITVPVKYTNLTFTNASDTEAGYMSAADKAKLDGIASGANNYVLPNATTSAKGGVIIGSNISVKNGTISISKNNVADAVGNASSSESGLMSATDKAKLDGIASGANAYTHPTNSGNKHIPSGGSSGQILRWSADGTATWGNDNNTTYSNATQSVAGLMSTADKTKLDGIATGANAYVHPSATSHASGLYKVTVNDLGHVTAATAVVKSDITGLGIPGSDTTYSNATQTASGLMSAEDKKKLNGIASGANSYSHPTGDGNLHVPTTGTSNNGKFLMAGSTAGSLSWGTPTDTKYTHPSYTAATSGLYKVTVNSTGHVSATTAVTKADITNLGIPSSDTTYNSATQSAAGLMSSADKTKLDGIATGANAYSHPTSSGNKHIPSGGSSGQILRWSADGTAVWGSDNNTTYNNATQSAAGLMSSADKTKLDSITSGANAYTHPTATAYSSGLYKVTVNSLGHVTAAAAVTKDDITGLGIPSSNTTYSAATQSASGLMSADDKKKLDGIASGANAYSHPTATAHDSGLYKITVNSLGHVTAATAVTKADITGLGIPSSDTNTDTKVTQTNTTGNADYRVLLSANANDTNETNTSLKSNKITANPSTGALKATKFITSSGIELY